MTIQYGDIRAYLSFEQVRVMQLVAKGLTQREIAGELGYSVRTIAARVCDVKNRLGTDSRSVALLVMRDAGILT